MLGRWRCPSRRVSVALTLRDERERSCAVARSGRTDGSAGEGWLCLERIALRRPDLDPVALSDARLELQAKGGETLRSQPLGNTLESLKAANTPKEPL